MVGFVAQGAAVSVFNRNTEKKPTYNLGIISIAEAQEMVKDLNAAIAQAQRNESNIKAEEIADLKAEIATKEKYLANRKERLARLTDELTGASGRLLPA